jgi:hypothetical protein
MTSGRICRKSSSIDFILDERILIVHSRLLVGAWPG